MKVPTYPDAVHSADATPMISRMPVALLPLARLAIGPLNVCAADAGPRELASLVSSVVIVCGLPTRPTTAIIATSAGKMDSTA
ncbi:MAG TPA: hypothetical protein VH307_18425 [Streptosporangiaceae bacterium]|jgi:hypothetical protein|nr:hypothetical protein [Streptosporangiaceae bacterium]